MSDTALHLHIHADRGPAQPPAVADLTGSDPAVYPRDLTEQHLQLVRWFEESELARMDEITEAEIDREYYDHQQWTAEEQAELKRRGQPELTINKIHDKVETLCGMERKARTDPKAFPRTPTEEDHADAATQALRYIGDNNNFDITRSYVFQNMLVEGAGGAELGLRSDKSGGADIMITWTPWDRIWYDPHSRSYDFTDARYLGLVIWMDKDQLEAMYPDRGDQIDASFNPNDFYYNDRPDRVNWTDNLRRRVRVVQCHWQFQGVWWQATYTRAGLLADPQRSPFKDRYGESTCSLQLMSAFINRKNQRYGMVRGLRGLQDEINKRRSKALHLLNVRQVVAEKGAVADIDQARREVSKPDGYVEIKPGLKFEIQDSGELATGQFQLLQHATAEMQLIGPNAAMSGTDTRELSGRAFLSQQAGGAVQNEPLADSLRWWARRVYEVAWQAAREHWTAGKWIRVTDDLNETRWVGINQQIRVMDKLAEMDPETRAETMRRMQLFPGDPRLEQVIGTRNDITDLDVDITVGEGLYSPTQEAEEFQTLVQLASVQPGLIPGDVLIAASSLKNKPELLQRMKEHQQAQAQAGQQAQQIQTQHAQAEIANKQAAAAAQFALAKEREANAARGVHDVYSDFTAPPYGQPHVADAPAATDAPGPLEHIHSAADLVAKHADLLKSQADLHKTRMDTALTAAKIPQVLVATDKLQKTPIPKPGGTDARS